MWKLKIYDWKAKDTDAIKDGGERGNTATLSNKKYKRNGGEIAMHSAHFPHLIVMGNHPFNYQSACPNTS